MKAVKFKETRLLKVILNLTDFL